MHCGDHRLHKARTHPTFIQAALPRHTEDPEPRQLASGVVIEPTGQNPIVTKELTRAIATLADSGSETALQPVGATTDFVLTGVYTVY